MKRMLSLVLSLILAWSLTIPSLAAEDLDPPLWQQMGFSSREECITYVYGNEDAYEQAVQEALERQQWEDAMAADIAAFDPDAYWESDECQYSWFYDSKEEFMEDWFLETEEEFRDVMLEDWLDQQWDAYWQETLVDRTRAELGAPAGQTGVMLDGTYLSFPGSAAPEVVNGCTMVPCGPLLTAFGGTVSHTGSDVTCTLDGAVYRLRSGSDTITVTAADGTVSEIPLGVACYEKNGATYLALRPFAEAMGCDVMWDSTFQTAVLLRRDKVIAQLDEQFTLINQMFAAMEYDASKNYKTVARMDAKLTMLDSINGDKQYPMDADVEMLQSGGTVNLKLTMDLSALLEIPGALDGMDPLSAAAVKGQLRNVKMEMIYDAEGGTLYLKMPLLAQLTGGQLDEDSWIAFPAADLTQMPVGTSTTMGAVLYQSMRQQVELMSSFGSYYFEGMITPAMLYREVFVSAEEAAAYLGDDCFEASGGYSVLHYDEEDYNAYLESEYGEGSAEYLSEFEQLEMELKVARSGAATFRVLMQTKDQGMYSPAMLLDISGSQSPTRVDLSMLMKLKNQFNLELTYTGNTTETDQKPNTAPPAGETVIDPYESYMVPEPAAA